jgi:hypothetical protein
MCDAKESVPDVANEILIYVIFKLCTSKFLEEEFAITIQ